MQGYTKKLFILPFDHRSSFTKGLVGKEDGLLTPSEKDYIISQKKLIYKAFKKAVENKVPKDQSAILVDEEYGDEILKDANLHGFNILLTTEKSGQKEYAFQYGENFGDHIKKYSPLFAKALVRYNPDDSQDIKKRQLENLKKLSDFCNGNNIKLLIEPLVVPTEDQLTIAHGDKEIYINTQRPFLAAKLIQDFQDYGIEPDVWKIEGTKNKKGYEEIVKVARRDNRENVGIVVLGGGQSREIVEDWIKTAADVKGIIGFAVGRTIFWQALLDLKERKINEDEAITRISNNFINFYEIFNE
ncbi:DUF2090 domain-containing protein [Patescibacteria group bacterium]|nr:DUF2090 domain-containing protein [Patescibacteria group bacterium]